MAVVLSSWFAPPSWPEAVTFALGWSCGWFLLWRPRPLPLARSEGDRSPLAIVVPARDEEHTVATLLSSVVPQLRAGDELVVVDDASTDATAAVAEAHGARVVPAPPLPAGWTGKCWACHHGVEATSAPVVVFVDADVTLAPGAVDRLAAAVAAAPAALVSVQPWHVPKRPYEQVSLLFNLTTLMASAAFTPLGPTVAAKVAFGPVLATTRTAYRAAGGHAGVCAAVAEDIALARRYRQRRLYAGCRTGVSLRMYPAGFGSLLQGWTKNMASGANAVPRWVFVVVVGWIWSLAGGPLSSAWLWLASSIQVWVLGRRAGRFSPLAALTTAVAVWGFVAVFLRSVVLTALGLTVRWRGRRVATR